jgi:hypothetical protein
MARTNNYWFAFHLNQETFMREATLINVFSFAQFGAFGLQWFYYFQKNLSILLVPQ